MKLFLLTIAISTQAFATPVINSKSVTCNELKDFVFQHGEVVVRTGLFRKMFVSETAHCPGRLQYAAPAYARTMDQVNCYVGETCKYEDLADCRGENYCGSGTEFRNPPAPAPTYTPERYDNYTTPSGPGYYGN